MSNRYFLRIGALGRFPELKIDHARFNKLKASLPVLTHALAIEEKYSIIINNFLALEREATNASVAEMAQSQMEYRDFFNVHLVLNTCLVNLLTSVRLYVDQLPRHVCACLPNDTDAESSTQALLSAEYDSRFEYRFMEALRNYVQHRDIPVHRISSGRKRTGEEDDSFIEISLYFCVQRKKLATDRRFNQKVFDEMPDEVNLKSATRVYVEAISNIHSEARSRIESEVESSRNMFDRAIRDYTVIHKKEQVGLYAYHYHGEEKVDEVSILTEWDDIRRELISRNGKLTNLGKCYVSSSAHNK